MRYPLLAYASSVFVCMLLVFCITGCAPKKNNEPITNGKISEDTVETKDNLHELKVDELWPSGKAVLTDTQRSADTFSTMLTTLLKKPTDANLRTSQTAWRNLAAKLQSFFIYSRLANLSTERYEALATHHFNIAAWPIQPGYLDGFGPYPFSGMVNDVGVPLTLETIRGQHGMTNASDVSLGIYAIEVLLFGERNLRGHLGLRRITALTNDMTERGYATIEELPLNRRRRLVQLQAQALLQDLKNLNTYWQEGPYGSIFTSTEASLFQALIDDVLISHIEDIETLSLDPAINTAELREWKSQQLAQRLQGQIQGAVKLAAENEALANTLLKLEKRYTKIAHQAPAPNIKADWKPVIDILQETLKLTTQQP